MGEIGKHFRDVKEHRKQQEQTTPPSQRCHDWIIVMGSHYAKDRSWFKEYYPINANVGVGRAIGIGTVELEVTSLRLWVCALQGISHTNKIKNTFKIKFLTS